MNKLDLSLRLRPLRFAYLVNPSDTESLLKIFESNTCLWGGMFNPIIPIYKRKPKWWDNYPSKRENFKQILKGYLNYFEPDFIVECKPGLGDYFGIPKEVAISLDDLIVNKLVNEDSWNAFGLNAFDIYKSLYQEEFKFQRRHSQKYGIISPKTKKYSLVNACLFGTFPKNNDFTYLESAFKDVFDSKIYEFDAKNLISVFKNHIVTPIRITETKCETFYSARNEPTLYIFDIAKPCDLIDYWNLRIIYPEIYAIPIQFIGELKEFCQDFIMRNHIPLPGNKNGIMVHTTIQSSRSISHKQLIQLFNEYLKVDKKDAAVIRSWYPSIWREPLERVWQPTRSVLNARDKNVEITLDSEYKMITFETLSPDFPESIRNRYRWANVIEISDWSFNDEVTTVYPSNLFSPLFPRLSHIDKLRSNTEGLVIYPNHKGSKELWTLSNGTSSMIHFLKTKNIKAEISEAGKTLQQIVRTIGGLIKVGSISNSKLIEMLNRMAHKQVKIEAKEDGITKEYLGRTIQFSEIKKLLNDISKDQIFNLTSLDSLIFNNVIQLGLEVECGQCGNKNWFLLNNLNYSLSCENCLKQFSFPSSNPTNRKINWAYRVIGPFSKPDYANGGYSSALALRLLKHNLGGFSNSKISWSTSLNLETSKVDKWEVDFLLWYQRTRVLEHNHEVEFIAGESKSYGKQSFRKKDIESLKKMAKYFPGTILVFATLKDELSEKEKELITPLALWGRESLNNGKTRAPVIILTSTELFATDDLRRTYEDKGGLFKKLVSPGYVDLENLRNLSNITQQLHLGLNSYHEWLEAKYKGKIKGK